MVSIDVTIDSREPPETLAAVEQCEQIDDWSLAELETGDLYFDEANVVCERKRPDDYAASVLNGRLDSQLHRMANADDRAYVLVEGRLRDFGRLQHTRIRAESLRGHTASTMARQAIPVVFCDTIDLLVDMAARLARKNIEAPTSSQHGLVVGPDVQRSTTSQTLAIYLQIDGVGPQTAKAIEAQYPSVSSLCAASVGDLQSIDGVGQKTATSIQNALS